MQNLRFGASAAAVAALLLVGCASPSQALYDWQGYPSHVDAYLRADKSNLAEQTQLMENDLRKIQASGKAIPPGYKAHLGLLYAKQGDLDRFAQHVQEEKKQFPESESFMDFLVRNFKK